MSEESARIRSLVARGVVEAGLAAHLSILLDAGVPLTLVSPTGSPTSIVADAFASSLRIDGSRPEADVMDTWMTSSLTPLLNANWAMWDAPKDAAAEIWASSNDEQIENHLRIAELCIERAKRLVELGRARQEFP